MIWKSAPHLLTSEDVETIRTMACTLDRIKKAFDSLGLHVDEDGNRFDYLEGSDLREFFDHVSGQVESFRINLRSIETNSKTFDPSVSREKDSGHTP